MEIPFSTLADSQLTDYDKHMTEVVAANLPLAALAQTIWTDVRQEMVNRGLTAKAASISVDMASVTDAALKEYDVDMHAAHAKVSTFSSIAHSVWMGVMEEISKRKI